jgi:hypothetical protein
MTDKALPIMSVPHGRVAHRVNLTGNADAGEASILDEFSALIGDLVTGTSVADVTGTKVLPKDPNHHAAWAAGDEADGDQSMGNAAVAVDAAGAATGSAGAIVSGVVLPPLPTGEQAKGNDGPDAAGTAPHGRRHMSASMDEALTNVMNGPVALAPNGRADAAVAARADVATGMQRRAHDLSAIRQSGPPATAAATDKAANMNLPAASLTEGDASARKSAVAPNPAAGTVSVVSANSETHRRPVVLKVDFSSAPKSEEPAGRQATAGHGPNETSEAAKKAIDSASRSDGDRARSQGDRGSDTRGREMKTALMTEAAAVRSGPASTTVVSPMDANGIAKVITEAAQRLARGEEVAAPVRLLTDAPGQETMPLKRLHLQLQSDSGGTVGLQIALSDDGMQIRMATSDSEIVRVLNGERDHLMTRLEDSGYRVLDLKVDHVEGNDMRFNADGGAPRQSGGETPGRGGRSDAQQQSGREFMRAEEGPGASEPEQTGSARGRGIYV